MKKTLLAVFALAVLAGCSVWAIEQWYPSIVEGSMFNVDALFANETDITPPPAVPASPQEVAAKPKDTSALGGYNVLIADRGNNRIIEVTPDKKIIWTYDFKGLPPGYGADDAFFADGGKVVIASLEYYHVIEKIDYQTKKILWKYGVPGMHGSGAGYLYHPDDAYILPNGDITVSDIQNCRILEIAPDKKIVRQYGVTRQCGTAARHLDAPNGDTPLPNSDTLISTILNHSVVELNPQWQLVFSMSLPIAYPSDPQPTAAGNIVVASYTNPGKIIETTRQGSVMWEYSGDGTTTLDKPSLAIELPNGNILSNDDFNHRVIVIDKQTKQIIWQYGVTGKPGSGPDQLNIPDGLSIIEGTSSAAVVASSVVHTVGEITRHATQYVGQMLTIQGYVLQKNAGYVLLSDEPTGPVGPYDLPSTGSLLDTLSPGVSYTFSGAFLGQGLTASNGNPDHFEATSVIAP
ncbi:MAG: hypothetical protein ACYC75_02615 [Minisyncoccota bacterium]